MIAWQVQCVHLDDVIIVRWLLISVIVVADHWVRTLSHPSLLQLTIHSIVAQRLPLTKLCVLHEVFVEFLLSQACDNGQQHEQQDKTTCYSQQTEPSLIRILIL